MFKKTSLILLILLFPFTLALNMDFTLTNPPLKLGETNQIDANYTCPILSPYYEGDLIDYKIYVYQNKNITLLKQGIIVYKNNCNEKITLNYQALNTSPKEPTSLTIALATKLHQENQWQISKTQTMAYTPPIDQNLLIQKATSEKNLLNFTTLAGIALLIASIILMVAKVWWSLIPFLISIFIIVYGIFF